MSEAVTNAEIEDVLSSIRRLVSENTAAESHRIGSAPSPEEALGKLVLTPAFRVHDGGQGAEEAHASETDGNEAVAEETATPVAEDAADDAAQPASDSLETRIAELEAAVGDSADWEPDGSEDEVGAEQTVVFEHAAWSARTDTEDAVPEAEFVDLTDTDDLGDTGEVISISPTTAEDDAPAMEQDASPVDPPEKDADAQPQESGFEEALIDEEALRRRLVRREIQRALTLQDFD